jgi:hypothetical protein
MATQGAMSRAPYGFSATTLPFFQKYMGVPCMRATLRAVFSASRSPRPTPSEKLSGFLRFLGILDLVVIRRARVDFGFARFLTMEGVYQFMGVEEHFGISDLRQRMSQRTEERTV